MSTLSRPIDEMKAHYTAVVVGSGYGGAIVAMRIARAGRDVAILERGKEMHPGDYPDSALSAAREMQIHTAKADHGSATGMFDFRVGPDITTLVGCGLGGTSLINANVALEPSEVTFADERWPAALRDHPGVLKPFMQAAREMLGSTPYPRTWPVPPKLAALERAAAALGREVTRPDINVTFVTGPNAAGVEQSACLMCGDCCSGCNHGAKNTVLMNYLPDAHAHGAHVFTEVAVQSVQRWQGKWRVAYDVLGGGRERYDDAPTQFLTADVVVLAAGTLGSTEILLRSRELGLAVSGRVGCGFSGNGDVLAFAYDTDGSVRGVGLGGRAPDADNAVGPTITGLIDLRSPDADRRKALIIEDGAIPGALAALLPVAMSAAPHASLGQKAVSMARRLREVASIPLGAYRGPVDRTLTYLVMSTDDSGGQIVLEDDRVQVVWPEVGDQLVFAHDNRILDMATSALGGIATPDPLWAWRNGRSLITVHPLGGCVMADDVAGGVVDHKGQVFDPAGGVHEGLYVCDGSVIPAALDVNPLLTISGLAERTAAIMIEERKWGTAHVMDPAAVSPTTVPSTTVPSTGPETTVPPTTVLPATVLPATVLPATVPATTVPPATVLPATGPSAIGPLAPAAPKARLSFTERLAGFVSMSVRDGYTEGYERGRDSGASVELLLTIDYDDVHELLDNPECGARISGTVVAPELSPHRLTVTDGTFTLLDRDPARVETWHMTYRMTLLAEDGRQYLFEGHKDLRKDGTRHAWTETSTLYTSIAEVNGAAPGMGILHLKPADLGKLIRSIEVEGVPRKQKGEYRRAFLKLFAVEMVHIYGGAADEAGAFPSAPRPAPPVREPKEPDGIWWCDSGHQWHAGQSLGGDAFLRLTRYKAGDKGPVVMASGFGMSSHSFLAPTIEENLAEFLARAGYDVWLFDYRAGIDLPSAATEFTIDDIARVDWPVAVAKVCEETGRDAVQAFGHCVGSVSLQMAILAGLRGIRTAVCAQFPMHPASSVFNIVKAQIHAADILAGLGGDGMSPDNRRSPRNELTDIALRTLPMPAEERCGQAVCRWINAVYGCTHRHAQLNDATHLALNDMFGFGNIESMEHLSLMLRKGMAVTHTGEMDYFDHPERMAGTRLLLLQGMQNYIFHPAGSLRTWRWLLSSNRQGEYERKELPGYAHLDAIVGSRAAIDVYPSIAEFLGRP